MTNTTSPIVAFTQRNDCLSKFVKTKATAQDHLNTQQQWDVIVIGGGIVGAGILQEATCRGFKALLIEQKDFSWGTSSRSSKMVHGGLRYIAQGDIKLTKHSLVERERLLKEAPGLVERLGYYFVLSKKQFPGRFVMGALLSVYDWLAGIKDHKFVSIKDTLKKFPNLSTQKLKGSYYYTDAVVDDARLVVRVLQDAIEVGAQVINYARVTSLIKDPDTDQVTGVIIEDQASDNNIKDQHEETYAVKASVVFNATGAWADTLRNEVIEENRVRPLRGSHLVVSQQSLKVAAALTLLHPKDKRPIFIFPWEGVTVIGTTDLDHQENLANEAYITQDEIDYLLQAVNHHFTDAPLDITQIISTFSGVRPVISSDNQFTKNTDNKTFTKTASQERRDHAIWGEKALITVSGGKLTTFRLTAIEALNTAEQWLRPTQNETNCCKKVLEHTKNDEVVFQHMINNKKYAGFEKQWLQRLAGRYGKNATKLLKQAQDDEKQLIGHNTILLSRVPMGY